MGEVGVRRKSEKTEGFFLLVGEEGLVKGHFWRVTGHEVRWEEVSTLFFVFGGCTNASERGKTRVE